MPDAKIFSEVVEVVPYNPLWTDVFEQEAREIRSVFTADRLVGLEHYGSTAVFGLCAKPIVDILVGLRDFSLSEEEKRALQLLGYDYIGRALLYERFFLSKRGQNNFHLAVVRYAGSVWCDNVLVRDYLHMHPEKAAEYALVKQQALEEGCVTFLEYATYKEDFVRQLVVVAREWAE